MARQFAKLRLDGDGDVEIELLSSFLADLDNAYVSILAFDRIINRYDSRPYDYPWDDWVASQRRPSRRVSRPALLNYDPEALRLHVPISDRLRLARVKLASPGFWEIVGNLAPLSVLREYLNDRHERRKDKNYRESAEKRRLQLENLQLENEVLSGRIKIAKDIGLTDSDLAPLVRQLIERPLVRLGEYQDRGVIGGASLCDPDNDRSDQ